MYERRDATECLAECRIVPAHVLDGLESTEEGIKLLKKGDQFGEVIIDLHHVTPSFDQALIPKVANIVQSWDQN